jgi:hypothetical protein
MDRKPSFLDYASPDSRPGAASSSSALFIFIQVVACGLELIFVCVLAGVIKSDPFGAIVGLTITSSGVAAFLAIPLSLVTAPTSKKMLGRAFALWHAIFLVLVILVIVYAATRPPRYHGPGGF